MALSSFTQMMIELRDKFSSARAEDLSERKVLNRYFPRMFGYNNNGNPTYFITALLIRFRVQQELVIFDKVFMMTLLMHVG